MWPLAGLHWITPQWPAPPNVLALTTLRGVATARDVYGGFNLAHHVSDDVRRVQRNRALLQRALGIDDVQWLDQVHGIDIVEAQRDGSTRCGDAGYTTQHGLACAVLTADCLPVVMCDRAGREVAVAHAGWRGLCAGVLEHTARRFVAPAGELLVWLGPAIGPQVFEVGAEVRDAFMAATPALAPQLACCFAASPQRAGHYLADLYQLARLRLGNAGVGASAVHGGGFCTRSDARFYSFRRAAVTGRQATLVLLRE